MGRLPVANTPCGRLLRYTSISGFLICLSKLRSRFLVCLVLASQIVFAASAFRYSLREDHLHKSVILTPRLTNRIRSERISLALFAPNEKASVRHKRTNECISRRELFGGVTPLLCWDFLGTQKRKERRGFCVKREGECATQENERVHIEEGIFYEMRKRLRSLLNVNEEAAFEIW